MSAATAPARAGEIRRRSARYPGAILLDVTVLRFGVPCKVPGRSLDLGEQGLGVICAAELRQGEAVGVELHLPDSKTPLRAKAVVRYQIQMRCGLEFVAMNEEHGEALHDWIVRMSETRPIRNAHSVAQSPSPAAPARAARPPRPNWRLAIPIICGVAIVVALLAWSHWERSWRELESQAPQAEVEKPPVRVPADVMADLLRHKTEPVIPDEARSLGANGVVVLQVTIGRDGTVVDMHPISGPQWLSAPAIEAVRWWRYEPYRVEGRPAAVETMVAVEFSGN